MWSMYPDDKKGKIYNWIEKTPKSKTRIFFLHEERKEFISMLFFLAPSEEANGTIRLLYLKKKTQYNLAFIRI